MGRFKGHKEIGSHISASGRRVFDGESNKDDIPHQSGMCERYEDHHFTVIGTVEVGGVELKKVRCRKPSCGFETTTPAT